MLLQNDWYERKIKEQEALYSSQLWCCITLCWWAWQSDWTEQNTATTFLYTVTATEPIFTIMALKPVLKMKVDELFLRWLSEPDTQEILRENLQQIAHGETLTQPSPRSSVLHKPNSPRHRPGSPTLSTSVAKLPSPRSPRRPLSSKNNHKNASVREDGKVCDIFDLHVSNIWMSHSLKLGISFVTRCRQLQNANWKWKNYFLN